MANGAGNGTGGKKNGLRNGSGIATIEHSENKEKTQKEINIMSEIRKIENFAAPELDVYARLSEPQLLHYYEPQPGLFLAESPRVIERALDALPEAQSLPQTKHSLRTARTRRSIQQRRRCWNSSQALPSRAACSARCTAARFRLWRKSAGMPAAWRFWKMS